VFVSSIRRATQTQGVSTRSHPTVGSLIGSLPPTAARQNAMSSLPERLLRAELPPLTAGPGDLARIKQEITADLAPYEAMHVLACLALVGGMFTRPGIYSELDEDSGATMEYVASILLERPSPEPTVEPGPGMLRRCRPGLPPRPRSRGAHPGCGRHRGRAG
jgi:hypothetical protein